MNSNNLEIILVESQEENTEIVPNPVDFSKVCRTCMNSNTIVVPILESKLQNGFTFVDLLFECVSVQIHPSDGLPLNICNNCLNEILRIYIFRKQCYDSELAFKKLLANSSKFKENEAGNNEFLVNIQSVLNVKEELSRANPKKTTRSQPISKNHKKIQECFKDEDASLEHRNKPKRRNYSRIFECEVCHKKFQNCKLQEHMRVHTKEKPYVCELCGLLFSVTGNLQRHMKIHTGERPHICDYCGKGFIQSGSLRDHLKTHKNKSLSELNEEPNENNLFTCKYCKRFFRRKGPYLKHLENHILNANKKTEDPEQPIEKKTKKEDVVQLKKSDKYYFCEICDRLCKSELLLKSHLLTHEGELSFLCSECGKSFKTKGSLKTHVKIHSEMKSYTCTVCFKSFTYITNLNSHMMIHTGLKPHRCKLCPKTFTQLTHLKYHLRTHNGERPYACAYCDKSFAVKGNLTVHVRAHTGDTPYVCTICNKGFYSSSGLKKHKKNHEGDESINGKSISSDDIVHTYEEIVDSDEIIKIEFSTNGVTKFNDKNFYNVIEITNTE